MAELRLGDSYQLSRANTSERACRALRNARNLSAILLDIELKGSDLNGIEIAHLIRGKPLPRMLPTYALNMPVLDTPIIFVTAHGAQHDEARLLAVGDRIISKPVDFGALAVALTQLHLARLTRRALKGPGRALRTP